MSAQIPIRTCLIGLGNVGQGLYLRTSSNNSHLFSIQAHESLELHAVVDTAIEKLNIDLDGVRIVKSIKEIKDLDIELVVVATSTSSHLEICLELVRYLKPLAVLLEKPVGMTFQECKEIKKCLLTTPTVLVNYQRNYDQKFIKQVESVASSKHLKGVIYYSNGAINNASHGLAMLIAILGKPTNVSRLRNSKQKNNFSDNLDFIVEFNEKIIYFISSKEEDYSLFRIELFSSNGSLVYDAGLERSELRTRIEDPIYSSRHSLTKEATINLMPDANSFSNVYKYLVDLIQGKSEKTRVVGANLELACIVQNVIERARN